MSKIEPFRTFFRTGLIPWEVNKLYPSVTMQAENIYIDLDGLLRPTPFKMPKSGLWYFDGQVFSQTPYNKDVVVEYED